MTDCANPGRADTSDHLVLLYMVLRLPIPTADTVRDIPRYKIIHACLLLQRAFMNFCYFLPAYLNTTAPHPLRERLSCHDCPSSFKFPYLYHGWYTSLLLSVPCLLCCLGCLFCCLVQYHSSPGRARGIVISKSSIRDLTISTFKTLLSFLFACLLCACRSARLICSARCVRHDLSNDPRLLSCFLTL